jgi:hypothetical protein
LQIFYGKEKLVERIKHIYEGRRKKEEGRRKSINNNFSSEFRASGKKTIIILRLLAFWYKILMFYSHSFKGGYLLRIPFSSFVTSKTQIKPKKFFSL